MQPRLLSISLDSLYAQYPDAPPDLQAFSYKGHTIAISFAVGLIYRVHAGCINTISWCISRGVVNKDKNKHTSYASIIFNGRSEPYHRVIKSCEVGRYLDLETDLIDHIDHNGLHNWASNLRLRDGGLAANNSGNHRNRRYQGMSPAYCVYWNKQAAKFHAHVRRGKTKVHLGHYANESAAAFASDIFTYHLHGDHARLNDPRCIPFYKIICRDFTDPYDLKAYILKNRLHIDRLFDGVVISREKFTSLQGLNP